jgi:hypothetical protein
MKNKLLLLCLTLFLVNCKPTKTITEYKEVIKVDTLIRMQTNTIYKGVSDTITIDNPCDSSGIINQFYAKLVLPNGTIQIKNKGAKLLAISNFNDVLSSDKQEKRVSAEKNYFSIQKEVIKYRIPVWAIITIILESLIILLYIYLKVSKFI